MSNHTLQNVRGCENAVLFNTPIPRVYFSVFYLLTTTLVPYTQWYRSSSDRRKTPPIGSSLLLYSYLVKISSSNCCAENTFFNILIGINIIKKSAKFSTLKKTSKIFYLEKTSKFYTYFWRPQSVSRKHFWRKWWFLGRIFLRFFKFYPIFTAHCSIVCWNPTKFIKNCQFFKQTETPPFPPKSPPILKQISSCEFFLNGITGMNSLVTLTKTNRDSFWKSCCVSFINGILK